MAELSIQIVASYCTLIFIFRYSFVLRFDLYSGQIAMVILFGIMQRIISEIKLKRAQGFGDLPSK